MTKARDDKSTTPPDSSEPGVTPDPRIAELERQVDDLTTVASASEASAAALRQQLGEERAATEDRERALRRELEQERDRADLAEASAGFEIRSGPDVIPLIQVRVGGTDDAPILRPAIVTVAHSQECVDLLVLMNGLADRELVVPGERERINPAMRWVTSATRGAAPGQWRPFGGE